MSFVLKAFDIQVHGHFEAVRFARSRSAARYQAWRDVLEVCPDWDFMHFAKSCRVVLSTHCDPRFGRQLLVLGRPAHWVGDNGQYVYFAYDGQDLIRPAHPSDVVEVAP